MTQTFLGLISGTSRDGIDAVAVDFTDDGLEVLAAESYPYSDTVDRALSAFIQSPQSQTAANLGELHACIGNEFAAAANQLLQRAKIAADDVVAIGSHGQTVWHAPDGDAGFSLQLGDLARIAARTGITCIGDFRAGDIAVGGQGAPLVPPFHAWKFGQNHRSRAIVNIGGIANVTVLDGIRNSVRGYDTGPGNGLMNVWTQEHKHQPFDRDGAWAASATIDEGLLAELLADPYFARRGPRSTGFEYFNRAWLDRFELAAADRTQATLLALTVETIATAIIEEAVDDVLICGGGANNVALMHRLGERLDSIPVHSTTDEGLHADDVEAVAFAWLARERLAGRPGNLPDVTGAKRAVTLGGIYSA